MRRIRAASWPAGGACLPGPPGLLVQRLLVGPSLAPLRAVHLAARPLPPLPPAHPAGWLADFVIGYRIPPVQKRTMLQPGLRIRRLLASCFLLRSRPPVVIVSSFEFYCWGCAGTGGS